MACHFGCPPSRTYGSTQLVTPPPMLVSAPLVAENCGLHSTSVPLALPVTLSPAEKNPKDKSPTATPAPALAVTVVGPEYASNRASEPCRSSTPSALLPLICR